MVASIARPNGFFDAMLGFYRRTLDIVFRHQLATLIVFFLTLALTAFLAIEIPKGFFRCRTMA